MNHKIITTTDEYPDVLIHRDTDSNGEECVVITAFGTIDGDDDQMLSEVITFQNSEMPQLFIDDFSNASANKWCEQNKISMP